MWILISSLFIIIIFLLWHITSPLYWKSKKIPYLLPTPIIGNLFPIIRYGLRDGMTYLYNKFPNEKYFGIHFVTKPTLFIRDPQLIQRICLSDFENFTSHGLYSNQERDHVGGNLFHSYGQQWKNLRQNLTHLFTPAKIKSMLTCIEKNLPKMFKAIDEQTENGKRQMDMERFFLHASSDIMIQTIFCIKSDLFENENSVFVSITDNLMKGVFLLRLSVSMFSSKLYDFFKFIIFEKEFNKILSNIVKDTVDYRNKQKVHGNDFIEGLMDLMKLKNPSSDEKYFPDTSRVPKYDLDTITSQALIFYVGGVETTSLTLTFLCYELALHPEIQEKCREEIKSIETDENEITVENVNKLVYLTAAIKESMRRHSSFIMINRECTKTYKVPDSDFVIDKGTSILIPPTAIHMDEKYYPEPEKFMPERFLKENKDDIKPGTIYFPFGEGPRTCIGMNFALLTVKLLVAKILQNYELSPGTKTLIPMKYAKSLFFSTPTDGMWLNLKRI